MPAMKRVSIATCDQQTNRIIEILQAGLEARAANPNKNAADVKLVAYVTDRFKQAELITQG